MATDRTESNRKSSRGFASMNAERRREIASLGGRSQGKQNNPGNFANNRRKAVEAGRKGGSAR
jgi:general stress protein YciG